MYSPSDIAFAEPPTTVKKVLTMEDYKNAILRGGKNAHIWHEQGVRWAFEEEDPGHLVGKLVVRSKHFVNVDVRFDTASFSISYKSSQNMNYNRDRNEIHPKYNRWIKDLEAEIQAEIARLKAS
jgi:hypothetical protein